jgi:hypothetical protein
MYVKFLPVCLCVVRCCMVLCDGGVVLFVSFLVVVIVFVVVVLVVVALVVVGDVCAFNSTNHHC